MILLIGNDRITHNDISQSLGWWSTGRLNSHWRNLTDTGRLLYDSISNVRHCFKSHGRGEIHFTSVWFEADICGHPFSIHQSGIRNIETNEIFQDKYLYKALYVLYHRGKYMVNHDLLPDRNTAFTAKVVQYAKEC